MRLTFREKMGYASAGITDSANYTFMGSYMLFFLTSIAHVKPATAGALIAAGSIISSLWGPVVGFLSDHVVTMFGKRRPFLMAASLPLAFSLILCFTSFASLGAIKNAYYGIMIVVFWCAFSTFYSPWLALGAEYTGDYSERTELRSVTYGVTLAGTAFGLAAPPMIVEGLCGLGMTESRAWQTMAAIVAVMSFCAIHIAIYSSRNKDRGPVNEGVRKKLGLADIKDLFYEYWEILKLKPTKFVIGACLCHITAQGIFFSDRVYYFTYNLELTATQSTLVMLAFPISGVITLFPVLKVSKVLDKRSALMLFLSIASAGCVVLGKVVGVNSFWGMVALTFLFVIGNSAFWQLMPVMIYDVCEYDEYETGKRREGIIVSLQTIMETICSGLSTLVLGTILQFTGFNEAAASQTPEALAGVEFSITIVPAILMLGCVCMTYKYPITKEVFEQLKRAIAERNR